LHSGHFTSIIAALSGLSLSLTLPVPLQREQICSGILLYPLCKKSLIE
jgi:hypothetical protein